MKSALPVGWVECLLRPESRSGAVTAGRATGPANEVGTFLCACPVALRFASLRSQRGRAVTAPLRDAGLGEGGGSRTHSGWGGIRWASPTHLMCALLRSLVVGASPLLMDGLTKKDLASLLSLACLAEAHLDAGGRFSCRQCDQPGSTRLVPGVKRGQP